VRGEGGAVSRPVRYDSTAFPKYFVRLGEYIDKKSGYLRWINNSGSSSDAALELEYQTRTGQVQMETLTMSFIRDACVRLYQRRTGLNDPVNLVTRKR